VKTSRFQYEYRLKASKLHRAVGDALRSYPLFANHECYQEYPVERIDSTFKLKGCHFDWAIPSLHLIIECMGSQHYTPTSFGGDRVAADQLKEIQYRDRLKAEAAINAGYTYMIVNFDEIKEITGPWLWQRYQSLFDFHPAIVSQSPTHKPHYDKEKARKYRKEQYERAKEWRKQHADKR
jgi:hypothetical protein